MQSQDDELGPGLSLTPEDPPLEHCHLFFNKDTMYRHHIVRFNYTTYNVRRDQDVVNPKTPHRYIMLLANLDGEKAESVSKDDHPFLYAQVLGAYHVNVIYNGQWSRDYGTRRVEFLWVRWFEYCGEHSALNWDNLRLDAIRFPPLSEDSAFGFVDPNDVLRSAHIVPAFASGPARLDGVGLSRFSGDSKDWLKYYVNR